MCTYPSCIDRSSIASRDATGKQTHAVERGIITDLCHGDLIQDSVLREGAGAHELQDGFTAAGEPGGGIRHHIIALA